jgi:hypothetical protein
VLLRLFLSDDVAAAAVAVASSSLKSIVDW